MPYDDVQKFSEAAVNKAKLLKEHPGKYFLRAVMAGFFIVVAMIFSNVVGNTFQSTDPAWGKLLGGIVGALCIIIFCGSADRFYRCRAFHRKQSCYGIWGL